MVLSRTGPVSTLPFRIEKIPLPDFESLPPPAAIPSPPAAGPTASLASQVVAHGKPAGVGTLMVGLRLLSQEGGGKDAPPAAARATGGWRWLETPTDARGTARLDQIAPGRYQVRRYWVPRPEPGKPVAVPDPLACQNAVVDVELPAGKETRLEPLIAAPPAAR